MKFLKTLSVEKQIERVHRAVAEAARRAGNLAESKHLSIYYRDAAHGVNPHDDWYGFAALRQKQHDYEKQYFNDMHKEAEAKAKVEAEKTKLKEMQ